MLWIILGLIVLVLFYYYNIRPISYWKNRGVIQGNPWPCLGDNWGTLLKLQSFPDMVQMLYNYGGTNVRYSGGYQFMIPTLILKDPDLIRSIGVKDFEHFLDHRSFIPDDCEPLWTKNLFALTGNKWREMRSTLSPTFTSNKMRQMFCLMIESSQQFTNYFLKQNNNLINIEMKDSFTRFTNDVIATTAFGVKVDSLEYPKNEFYLTGLDATDFSGVWKNFKFVFYTMIPSMARFFKIRLFSEQVSQFFRDLVKNTIETREKKHIIRPDMIHLLMEARKTNGLIHEDNKDSDAGFATVEESHVGKQKTLNKKLILSDDDITAQALIFFFAGFDTVSTLMSFMSYELAVNPDIQKRLIEEVDGVLEKCEGKLTYEALLGMKYLDMVVSESLRKWPNAIAVDRVCTKPYTIPATNPNERPLHLDLNNTIWIPIYAVHRDPRYWPEPERFDPERFNDDNKSKIIPYTFIPFGVGPRNCIGSRFALLETKSVFFHLLTHFEFIPIDKTPIPITFKKSTFNLSVNGGIWLGLKKRNK